MTPKNIKCNFTSVFAQFNTIEEIREVANNICAQVKSAYEAREKELQPNDEIMVEAIVEIVDETEVEESKKKAKKSGSKVERAKEMAAKLKNEKDARAETKPKKETKTETNKEAKDNSETLIAVTDMEEIKKLGLKFKKYNDKCYVLRGETKPLRKVLKEEFKGVFNGHLVGGEGWIISAKHAENCAKALGLKIGA